MVEPGPMKAYELIAELERLFGPHYRPSPGGVYPALNALVAERLLATDSDGHGKRYRLTKLGGEALDARQKQLAALEARTSTRLRDTDPFHRLLDDFVERVTHVAPSVDHDDLRQALDDAALAIEKMGARHDQSR